MKSRLGDLSRTFSLNGFALGLTVGVSLVFLVFLFIGELPADFGKTAIISTFFSIFTVLGTIFAAGLALSGVKSTIDNANRVHDDANTRKRLAADATVNIVIGTIGEYAKQYICYRVNPPIYAKPKNIPNLNELEILRDLIEASDDKNRADFIEILRSLELIVTHQALPLRSEFVPYDKLEHGTRDQLMRLKEIFAGINIIASFSKLHDQHFPASSKIEAPRYYNLLLELARAYEHCPIYRNDAFRWILREVKLRQIDNNVENGPFIIQLCQIIDEITNVTPLPAADPVQSLPPAQDQ